MSDLHVQRGIGTKDTVQLVDGQLGDIGGVVDTVLAKGLGRQRHGHYVVARLGQRKGHLGHQAVAGLDIRRFIDWRQHQNGAGARLLECRIVDGFRRYAAAQHRKGEGCGQGLEDIQIHLATPLAFFSKKSI